MDLKLTQMLQGVKLAILEAADQSERKRLPFINEIRCRPGCAGCCSRLLYITVAEALILYEYLSEQKLWVQVKKRAEEQAKLANSVNAIAWFKLNIKCSILDPESKKCLAYKVRPPVCSTHFVTSDPALCDPWSPKNGDIKPKEMSDVYENSIKSIFGQIDANGIFKMILPIPLALLLAERVQVQSGLNSQQVISLLFNELR